MCGWQESVCESSKNHCAGKTGITVRLGQECAPLLEDEFRKKQKRPTGMSWRMDETYVKNKGKWGFLYRAVDKEGDTVDFMFSAKRDRKAALRFFKKAINSNGLPHIVTIDKSGANNAALEQLNELFLTCNLCFLFIIVRQIKYLNNIVEQNHRHIKCILKPMLEFKSFASAKATIAGVSYITCLEKDKWYVLPICRFGSNSMH